MIWQTTKGITIQVVSEYSQEHSKPSYKKFVHSYHINIINDSEHTVQLLRRHWYIHDSDQTIREVEGSGVIGEQPIIRSGDNHTYLSWSALHTTIGKMHGNYTMINLDTNEKFTVEIPEFPLVADHKLN